MIEIKSPDTESFEKVACIGEKMYVEPIVKPNLDKYYYIYKRTKKRRIKKKQFKEMNDISRFKVLLDNMNLHLNETITLRTTQKKLEEIENMIKEDSRDDKI